MRLIHPAAILRKATIGSISGICGGIVLGIGGRASMRAIALGAGLPPGFSLGGTVEVLLTGLLIGVPAAFAFVLLRRFLPRRSISAGAPFGALLLLALTILPPPAARSAAASVDRLGVTLVAFAPVFIAYGVLVAWVADRMSSRRLAALQGRDRHPDGGEGPARVG